MKPARLIPSMSAALLAILTIAAAPEHPAITQYRAYAAAVRAGDEKAVLKLAAPVSRENEPLQLAHVRSIIALEQLRKETVAQLGPIDYQKDDGWMDTGIFPEEMTRELQALEHNGWVGVMAKNPRSGQMDLTVAIMKKANGKWLMPFAMFLNTEDGNAKDQPPLSEPKGGARDDLLQEFTSHTKAAPQVIKRLQNKEFKNRSEVLSALTELSSAARANGQVDK